MRMYASIRQYRVVGDAGEVARRAQDGFTPIVREVPGFSAWYLVDGGDGSLVTVTLCDDQAGVEESVNRAAGWVRDNIAEFMESSPTITNGEVTAQA
jgi:hypothetical protein